MGVVPAEEAFRYVLPSISMQFVQLEQLRFFFEVPRFFVYCGVEVIVPAFSTLLACAGTDPIIFFKFAGDFSPVIETVLRDQFTDSFVFLNEREGTSEVQDWRFIVIYNNLYLLIPYLAIRKVPTNGLKRKIWIWLCNYKIGRYVHLITYGVR